MNGHMINIFLTHSDEEAIVDFVKDHEEFYDKTNKQFKDKARKECPTWFKSQRNHHGKLTQSKSGQASKEMTQRQN